jgi:2-iminobutanoate/2-iminopropanoate deaminase
VPASSAVIVGDIVVTAGQVGLTPEGKLAGPDFETQVEQVYANLEACLAAAGCTFDDVFRVQGYLASFDDFEAYNAAYVRRFVDPLPARTTIQVGLHKDFLVEIELWATQPR